ncbi:hypothetical protein [Amycolatopsis anabasis]|uniref:hypothetical protein n=1 Tax=Amycolatopsis anabasis TaxID=1840409 RepID=UPI00131AFC62|nr:hypothetical protein [Amycolatopsis anabasis]
MRVRVVLPAALAVAVATLLGACSVAVSGSGDVSAADRVRADRRAVQRAAVDEALRTLSGQGAIAYRVTGTDAGGNPLELTLNVTRNGTVSGSFPAGGQQVKAVRVDGKLYLTAPAAYWQSQGIDAAKAGEYATRWVRADPARLPLDPGAALTPAAAADALRGSLATMDHVAEPIRRTLADGTEVFDLNTGAGRLEVSTAKPHRVVSAEPTLFGAAVGQAFGVGGSVRPQALTGDAVRALGTEVEGAAANLGQPLVAGSVVQTAVEDKKLDCVSTGACTETVQVRNTVSGAATGVSVRVVLRSVVTAEGLGLRDCGQEAVAAPNTVTGLSCTVKFDLPRTSGSAQVVALPTITGDLLAQLDAEALKQKVRTEFSALGG